MRAQGYPLPQLPQLKGIQLFVQLGLAHKQYLEQFLFFCLQIGQKPNLFEQFDREILGIVHHNHIGQFSLVASNKILAEVLENFALGFARYRKTEFRGNVVQKLQRRQAAIEDIGAGDVAIFEHSQKTAD